MLRILHMIGSLEMGGSQSMVMSLYRAIDKTKYQFDFIVDCDTNLFEEEIRLLGGRVFRLPKFNGRNLIQVRRAWSDFLADHPEYRVLHSHVRSYASLYLPVAKARGLKTIVHSHNTSNGHGIAAFGKMLLQYPLRYQADYFFGCSEKAGEWLFGRMVVASERYFMLKNAVDTERFAFRHECRDRIRLELGVGADTLLVGHVGRMHPQKNHCFLIECFREMLELRGNAKLLLLGDGALREEIMARIRALGLEDNVLAPGIRANVEEYFSAMDCLALPSLHEGLPVVVVEAQASGLPCFVSDTVTQEVRLSELVRYLPIDQGKAVWAEALSACEQTRRDVSDQIKSSGFSIRESSRWLCDFYGTIAGGE